MNNNTTSGYSFRNDYSEGAHPQVMQALNDSNLCQSVGYGMDTYCEEARELIKKLISSPDSDVHFLVGGTQTNLLVIESFLRPYESVIAADTGHVNVHETGAIEATGHKVCTVPSPDGKLTPQLVDSVVKAHESEHMVLPRLVYISDTTEIGTIYTKAELASLYSYCKEHELYLYLDGARLGSALSLPENDLTLADLAALTDAFTIGGTKNGALFGEALILTTPNPHFRWHIKQRGAMLAKGRLLGIQFKALMEDGLYFEIASHANAMARQLRDGIASLGYGFSIPSPSNQQFPIFPNSVIAKIAELGYDFEKQFDVDDEHSCIRFVTSWATPQEAVEQFLKDLGCI